MNKLRLFFLSRRSWTLPYLIFSIIFVIVPLLLIVVYAFTDDAGRMTLENFRKFLAHPEAVNTFIYSIGIAILTTIGCIVLGYPAAWILSRSNSSYSRTLILLFILPQHPDTYAGYRSFVRLCQSAFRRRSVDIRNDLQLHSFHDLSDLQYSSEDGPELCGSSPGFRSQFFPGILEGGISFVHAWSSERHHDGVHADHLYLCHCRIADHEQHQVVWYDYSGEYQQQYVELWSSPFLDYAVPDCGHFTL